MLDLYLEVKEPGSDKYERINSWPEKIQTNEYSEETNTTLRIWGMLPSFSYLKNVGEVRVRANVSDGVNKWSTAQLLRAEATLLFGAGLQCNQQPAGHERLQCYSIGPCEVQ